MKKRHALFVMIPVLALLLSGCGEVWWCYDWGCYLR